MNQADSNLVERASDGDVHAFTELVRTYTNAICAVAFGVLGDYHLAQDVAQETFTRAYLKLNTLQEPQKFGSWLYSIASRLSLDWKRKQGRESRFTEQLDPDFVGSSAESAAQHDLQLDIRHALHKLDEPSRAVMMLFYMSEMSMAAIAAFLNVSVSAVESRLRRTRKLLREDLLTSWGQQFHTGQSTDSIVTRVVERIVKQVGHYYIPVTDKEITASWFVTHFGINLDRHGNLLLPSGHRLYLIEVRRSIMAEQARSGMPVLVFTVDDAACVYEELKRQHIRVEPGSEPGALGTSYSFYDPDGNRFGIVA